MVRSAILLLLGTAIVSDAKPAHGSDPTAEEVSYSRDIKSILSNSCYTCHGPDEKERKADLRLDQRESALLSAITPGKPLESELIARITSNDPDLQMPPAGSNRPPLSAAEIDRMRRWIEQGAKFDQHWSYVKPQRPQVPAEVAKSPIDYFVNKALAVQNLPPQQTADPRTRLRRVSFDLTGLPPTNAEVAQFAADPADEAYAAVVARLLASPAFGERMAIHWLDLVRYADSVGIHGDQEWSMSPYRDYVISAFNQNMPFDQFTIEQLAGDLLPDATRDQQIASGYNRLNMITAEGGAQNKEYLAKYAADRVRTTSTAWLGATMGCCECHDHKFDPYSIREFYQFAAFFADLQEKGVYAGSSRTSDWGPKISVPDESQAAKLKELDQQLAAAQASLDKLKPPAQVTAAKKEDSEKAELTPAEQHLADLQKSKEALLAEITTTLVSVSTEPRTMRLLPRGNWMDESGEIVEPGVPAAFGASPTSPGRLSRLDLANWMVDRNNPVTARIFVNRLWQLMFGRGLVASSDDFGSQGAVPSHPELLDWLAVEFIDSGWDVKHIVQLIVQSDAYQRSSDATEQQLKLDPTNRWLSRQSPRRLAAEMIRDNALAASGLLVETVGGESAHPYQPAGYWSHLNFPKREYQADTGAGLYRRGLYTHWQRTYLHPSLAAFDAPTREECTVQRRVSNTPLQALVLMNDPIYVEAARALAARLLQEGGATTAQKIDFGMHAVLQRSATPAEVVLLTNLYEKHREEYQSDVPAREALLKVGEYPTPANLDAVELAAWLSVCRVLLNLHETINRY